MDQYSSLLLYFLLREHNLDHMMTVKWPRMVFCFAIFPFCYPQNIKGLAINVHLFLSLNYIIPIIYYLPPLDMQE